MPRFIHVILALFLILFAIFIVGINVFSYAFVGKEANLKIYFEELGTELTVNRIPFRSTELRYIQTGLKTDTAPMILFIHGAPGSMGDFKSYLADFDLKNNFKLVSMDRLGYNPSAHGKYENNLAIHAEAAAQIVRSFNSSEVFVIGHSYGGPIAAKLVVDYPELIDGVIMLAPLNDPESEPMPWYSTLANTFFIRLLMPEFVNVASDEKQSHAEALRKIKNDWSKISKPILHIHGKKDGLAPCDENIQFSKKHIPSQFLEIDEQDEMGHLLIWNNAKYIKKRLFSFIMKIREKK